MEFRIIENLRNASPMQNFLSNINQFVYQIRVLIIYRIIPMITNEPLFMWIFGFIAVSGAIGILRRMLSRD